MAALPVAPPHSPQLDDHDSFQRACRVRIHCAVQPEGRLEARGGAVVHEGKLAFCRLEADGAVNVKGIQVGNLQGSNEH
eukprot:1043127-Pelagomonas_calceolata.AAC.2